MNDTRGRWTLGRWLLVTFVGLLVLGAAGSGVYFWLGQRSDSTSDESSNLLASATVCSDELIQKAADAINADDSYQLSLVASDAVELSEYKSDVNCVYVVLTSDLMSNFADDNTRALADRYRAYYERGVFISSIFGATTLPSDIDDTIAAIETVDANYDSTGRDETNTGDSIVSEPGVFVEDAGNE